MRGGNGSGDALPAGQAGGQKIGRQAQVALLLDLILDRTGDPVMSAYQPSEYFTREPGWESM